MRNTDFILWRNTRKNFPVLSQYIYANTASAGPLSDGLIEWRQEHDLDYLIGASNMKTKARFGLIPEVRKTVASFLVPRWKIRPWSRISLWGLNMLLEGLDQKHRVLLLESDYPSVNWPFEYRDFPIFYARIDEHLEEHIIEKVRAENISVLALSLIQWVSGIKVDLEFLKKLKKEFPDLIIIADGTQFCGTSDFNFEDSAIDVLGASAYKWLLGGYGNGFMLFKDSVKDSFSIRTMGFNSANTEINGMNDVYFANHFEPGHLDTFNFGSLKFSLDYLLSLGKANIEQRLNKLSQKAKTEFANLGLLNDAVLARKTHSTIFNVKGNDAIFRKLTENQIIGSQRGDGIRLSFHFYNTEKDIDQIVKILGTGK